MSKKMIDVDVLIKELQNIRGNLNFCNDAGRYWLDIAIETINELATHTEPQESIFDADGWCFDFDKFKDYYSEHGFLIKTDTCYTTIKCREQYRLCLKGVIAWRPLPTPPKDNA